MVHHNLFHKILYYQHVSVYKYNIPTLSLYKLLYLRVLVGTSISSANPGTTICYYIYFKILKSQFSIFSYYFTIISIIYISVYVSIYLYIHCGSMYQYIPVYTVFLCPSLILCYGMRWYETQIWWYAMICIMYCLIMSLSSYTIILDSEQEDDPNPTEHEGNPNPCPEGE